MFEPRQYAEWIHGEIFQPVIVVIGTANAKTRIKEINGLSLAELFAPFGGHFPPGISVSVQSLERQIAIEHFRVQFTDADSAVQLSQLQADQLADWTVESSALERPTRSQSAKALEAPSPWYEEWRSALFRSLRWSDHEGLDQPTAALLVVMSKESDPAMLLEQLLHSSNMPPLCTQGVLDPVPSRVAVLLHDASDPASPSKEELVRKLENLKTSFAPNQVFVLEINHGPADHVEQEIQDLFKTCRSRRAPPPPPAPNESPSPSPGTRLSQEDLTNLAQVVTEVVVKNAVPWMEKQLQQLEAQISQSRKGFRNQLKYLWRKPREANERGEVVQEDSGAYPLHSVEGQMRLAGDLSFHLRDYEVALGYYRNVVSDFKQDKSWKHAAGAYEMWGLCAYITNGARSEWNRCMESAYEHYLQASSTRLAMRAVVLHQAMWCDLKEAALRLMKVNGDLPDNNLRNALILEQAGQLYYTCGAPRKGAFHLVLAGHTYNKLGFKRLALFSYQAVVDLYIGKGWFHITDHFHFTMARQAFGLGLKDESLSHFLKLLNSFADADKYVCIQAERENTYIKEFLYVLKDWVQKKCSESEIESVELQIPCIQPEVRLRLPDDQPMATALPGDAAATSPKNGDEAATSASWELLGEKMLPTISPDDRMELNWRQRSDARIFDTLRRVTTVGSEVSVELTLTNPMRVKWEMRAVRLTGELQDDTGVCDDAVMFPSQDVTLGALESRTIQLTAVPKKEGLLKIRSVTWGIFDCQQVICDRPFQFKGRRLRNTLEQRASQSGVYSDDLRLEIKVRSNKPRLSACLEGLPELRMDGTQEAQLLQGELHKCSLVMRNVDCPLAFLHISTSHPNFVAFDRPEGNEDLSIDFRDEGIRLKGTFPKELRVPVLLFINARGLHALRYLLLAEAVGDGIKSEQRQWITLEELTRVEPALSLSARPSPSYASDGRILFNCHLENKAAVPLQVQQVQCFSGTSQLQFHACGFQGREIVVEPGQMAQMLYSLRPGDERPAEQSARLRLLQANRKKSRSSSLGREKEPCPETVDLVAQWQQGDRADRTGEAFALQVPLERPEAPPCPLDLHLLAPEVAEMAPDLLVPVTVRIRNASMAGSVSFYFVAESSADIAWIGCERSEIISLPPNTSHTAIIYAYFVQPGVYNLNRFRLFVVGMPSGSVPASEQAPLAFAVPFERLLHVVASQKEGTVG